MTWPTVQDELTTMRAVAGGASLARYGDCEMRICVGMTSRFVPAPTKALKAELIRGLDSSDCLVGIVPPGYRGSHEPSLPAFEKLLPQRVYYSAAISRYYPVRLTKEFAELAVQMWAGKRALFLGRARCTFPKMMRAAASVTHLPCPAQNAYAEVDKLEAQIIAARPDVAILAAGVAATCLVTRLAKQFQSIDWGHLADYEPWRKTLCAR